MRPLADDKITADLIAGLLREQHPDLAGLPLTFGARGWDNQMWRLGDDLAVRLPRHPQDGDLLLKEHALLPALAPRLPVQIPVPQRLGQPSERFPRPWIVTTWVAGQPADRTPATRGAEAADTLAAFLAALHQPAPEDAPAGRDGEGGPLADADEDFAHNLKEAIDRGLISDPDAVREVWDDAVAAPAWTGPPLLLHGDLKPANVLTTDGNFCGVVDWGVMCAGDPACDLAACWTLLPDGFIDRFHHSYSPAADAPTQRRARGWALRQALGGGGDLLTGEARASGGKATREPPAKAALRRLTATTHASRSTMPISSISSAAAAAAALGRS